MLEEWFVRFFFRDPKNPGPGEEMVAAFKRVRKARQVPAHAVREDDFDQKYFKEQREISCHKPTMPFARFG